MQKSKRIKRLAKKQKLELTEVVQSKLRGYEIECSVLN